MSEIFIQSMGHYHPPTVIDNHFIDSLDIGSDAAWVKERTGIESRRSVMSPSDILAVKEGRETLSSLREKNKIASIAEIAKPAWEQLVQRAPSTPEPDMLICGTSVPDFDIPANACTIADAVGLDVISFDANSACSSFIIDLHIAKGLLLSAAQKEIAIFNPERYSLRVDFNDRNTCVLFGDGSAATLLSTKQENGGLKVLDTVIMSNPKGHDLVKIPDGQYFSQNGKAVQKFAITKTIEITRAILDRNRLSPEDIHYFTGHQANLRMIFSAADRLGFAPQKHLFNVNQFGNQGAAGAPAVLSMNWDKFQPGEKIVVAVVGSGLTWGAALLEKV